MQPPARLPPRAPILMWWLIILILLVLTLEAISFETGASRPLMLPSMPTWQSRAGPPASNHMPYVTGKNVCQRPAFPSMLRPSCSNCRLNVMRQCMPTWLLGDASPRENWQRMIGRLSSRLVWPRMLRFPRCAASYAIFDGGADDIPRLCPSPNPKLWRMLPYMFYVTPAIGTPLHCFSHFSGPRSSGSTGAGFGNGGLSIRAGPCILFPPVGGSGSSLFCYAGLAKGGSAADVRWPGCFLHSWMLHWQGLFAGLSPFAANMWVLDLLHGVRMCFFQNFTGSSTDVRWPDSLPIGCGLKDLTSRISAAAR